MKKQKNHRLTEAELEALMAEDDLSDLTLDDDKQEEQETSFNRETFENNYDVEDDYNINEVTGHAIQLNNSISFDSIKLMLPLTEAEFVEFDVRRDAFFRCSHPEKPTTVKEDRANLIYQAENPVRTIELTKEEEDYADKSMIYEYAKKKYPNSKPFFDYCTRQGVGHMYIKDGYFIFQISGKITARKGYLGLINKDNIKLALNKFKSEYVIFDNDKFMEKAQVLIVHITNDIKVSDTNSYIKAISAYLPLRTDNFNVLMYKNYSGYEILPRGKQTSSTSKHSLCIYAKAGEIDYSKNSGYQDRIGREGLQLAENVIRIELRLFNFKAIRTFLSHKQESGTLSLRELLNSDKTPILDKLKQLEITHDNLLKARGEYISMSEDKLPTLAQLERMHGVIHLLKQNNYSLDKVRSYLEVETGKKIRSDELKRDREALQRYIACYKPRTVALLTELLACMSY